MEGQFEVDEKFMLRAIALARQGMGNVAPNPMVGCVIVHQGVIIGEGYHRVYGGPHAEVNAINSVRDKTLLKDSTLYVTLEPCAHFGKTPPCSDLILQVEIPRVVVGTGDPFAQVAGKGIGKLRSGGCLVIEGFLEGACLTLNRRFFTFHRRKRPYIILKWAQTADGFIDIDRTHEHYGQPTWITNELSRRAVHKMRADESAIMVGANTARIDNPSLTVRDWSGNSPVRIVIDKSLNLTKELALFDQTVPTIVYTSGEVAGMENPEYKKIVFNGCELDQILEDLHRRGVLSLIVEGGQRLLTSFIQRNLWDEARVFTGKCNFYSGVRAPAINAVMVRSEELDDSWMFVFELPQP